MKRNLLRNASVISQFQWHRRSRFCSDRRATPHGSVPDTWVTVYSGDIGSYELGDIAVAGARDCTCGRTLPVIARIEGRTRNMFVFRDGTRVWPRWGMVVPMHAFVPFRQYQLVQLDYETIEFRYLPDGSGRKPDLAGLNAYARQVFHPSAIITLRALSCFTPGSSGKFEEFLSQVPAAMHPAAPTQ